MNIKNQRKKKMMTTTIKIHLIFLIFLKMQVSETESKERKNSNYQNPEAKFNEMTNLGGFILLISFEYSSSISRRFSDSKQLELRDENEPTSSSVRFL